MKISLKVKGIIKKIALALAGVAALGLLGWGVKAIVDYTKNDLKTIHLSYDVGNLGADGKYVDDESTLYTKEAFGCYGLQVKPDFDSTVNYQIFYYDILDNYISSTEVMSDGYSGEAPLNGAYARIVIEPKNDEDGKISWTEKISYPKQLTLKVSKNQDINGRFVSFDGKLLQRVETFSQMVFENGISFSTESMTWNNTKFSCATTSTFLSVNGGYTITADFTKLTDVKVSSFSVVQFSGLPGVDTFIEKIEGNSSNGYEITLSKQTKYIIVTSYKNESLGVWTDTEINILPNCFSISK